ncbi:hypothetical protein J8V57_00345 [Xenorhabdus sp. PB61.4]|nr:hypothetical protein [Xenorhabdus sp. PB61.4]MCC8364741.1 hypothetical protein [Xenorhabdus sp. PB61.4]
MGFKWHHGEQGTNLLSQRLRLVKGRSLSLISGSIDNYATGVSTTNKEAT